MKSNWNLIKLLLILWIHNSAIHWSPPLGMRLPVITVTFSFFIKRLSSGTYMTVWTQVSALLLSNLNSILVFCSSWFPFLLSRVLWFGYLAPNIMKNYQERESTCICFDLLCGEYGTYEMASIISIPISTQQCAWSALASGNPDTQ